MTQTLAEEAFGLEFESWLNTPPGRYLLAWEQAQFDRVVADLFGYHALQLGVPTLRALRANRMPHRWLAIESDPLYVAAAANARGELPMSNPAEAESPVALGTRLDLRCHFDALPFKSQSLDLVILPHVLELVRDPHETLREVERVLVPEGRLVIAGFNSASLWGLAQRAGQLRRRLGASGPSYLPRGGEFIGYRRLRDWLRLLSMDIVGGRFGCYAPPLTSESWLQRFAWMDKTGDRWWPVFGAVYFIVAVKRVRGMRLVGLSRQSAGKGSPAPAVVAHRGQSSSLHREGTNLDS